MLCSRGRSRKGSCHVRHRTCHKGKRGICQHLSRCEEGVREEDADMGTGAEKGHKGKQDSQHRAETCGTSLPGIPAACQHIEEPADQRYDGGQGRRQYHDTGRDRHDVRSPEHRLCTTCPRAAYDIRSRGHRSAFQDRQGAYRSERTPTGDTDERYSRAVRPLLQVARGRYVQPIPLLYDGNRQQMEVAVATRRKRKHRR